MYWIKRHVVDIASNGYDGVVFDNEDHSHDYSPLVHMLGSHARIQASNRFPHSQDGTPGRPFYDAYGKTSAYFTGLVALFSATVKEVMGNDNLLIGAAVAWNPTGVDGRFYDYSGLAASCDFLFIMDYCIQSQVRMFVYAQLLFGINSWWLHYVLLKELQHSPLFIFVKSVPTLAILQQVFGPRCVAGGNGYMEVSCRCVHLLGLLFALYSHMSAPRTSTAAQENDIRPRSRPPAQIICTLKRIARWFTDCNSISLWVCLRTSVRLFSLQWIRISPKN